MRRKTLPFLVLLLPLGLTFLPAALQREGERVAAFPRAPAAIPPKADAFAFCATGGGRESLPFLALPPPSRHNLTPLPVVLQREGESRCLSSSPSRQMLTPLPTALQWMKTPNIDKFTRTATVFLRAYVQQQVCSPSRNR